MASNGNTNFLEIERKYKADTVDWDAFVKKCKSYRPKRQLLIRGPDSYFHNGDDIIRWRRSKDLNQLTIKSRFTNKSSLIREEVEITMGNTSSKEVIRFVKALGYEKLFRIYKTCYIFWIKNKLGEVSIVIYDVEFKGEDNKRFIEIEAEKGQDMKTSKELIRYWENELDLKEHWRLNKTLLELYSDRTTRLLDV